MIRLSGLALLVLLVAGCGSQPPVATPIAERTAPVALTGRSVGEFGFGSSAGAVLSWLEGELGTPDTAVGPVRYHRGEHERWYEEAGDSISMAWTYPVLSVRCWQSLCVVLGGTSEDALALRGWELSSFNRWSGADDVDAGVPVVDVARSGVRLGDPWPAVHDAFPATRIGSAEGASLAVKDTPWTGIFDGVAQWRLSGTWDFESPGTAPPDAVLTRISAGEGPEPGCC